MRLSQVFLISIFILLSSDLNAFAENIPQAPESQDQKEGYSVGYQIGSRMRYDGADLDLDSLMQGIRDAAAGKDPAISREEIKQIILDIRENRRIEQLKKQQEIIVNNYEESKAFMEENSKRDGIHSTESGLQYKVLQEGDGVSPTLEDVVTVHYRGTFIDGTQFDSSYEKGKPQTFKTDGVIRGWTEALQMMKENAKWQLFVPPDLAYGRSGLPGSIPPNKVLVFEIELLSIDNQKGADQSS